MMILIILQFLYQIAICDEPQSEQTNPEEAEEALKIGNSYFKGDGVAQDYSRAIEYYERSAKLGNPIALNILGDCYSKGEGVYKNYGKAFIILIIKHTN